MVSKRSFKRVKTAIPMTNGLTLQIFLKLYYYFTTQLFQNSYSMRFTLIKIIIIKKNHFIRTKLANNRAVKLFTVLKLFKKSHLKL